MKNICKILGLFVIILLIGALIGYFWCKSTYKPIIIEKPGQTITVT